MANFSGHLVDYSIMLWQWKMLNLPHENIRLIKIFFFWWKRHKKSLLSKNLPHETVSLTQTIPKVNRYIVCICLKSIWKINIQFQHFRKKIVLNYMGNAYLWLHHIIFEMNCVYIYYYFHNNHLNYVYKHLAKFQSCTQIKVLLALEDFGVQGQRGIIFI